MVGEGSSEEVFVSYILNEESALPAEGRAFQTEGARSPKALRQE